MTEAEVAARWNDLSQQEREAAWLTRLGFSDHEIALKMDRGLDETREALQRACAKVGVGDPLALALCIVYHRLEVQPARPTPPASQELQAG